MDKPHLDNTLHGTQHTAKPDPPKSMDIPTHPQSAPISWRGHKQRHTGISTDPPSSGPRVPGIPADYPAVSCRNPTDFCPTGEQWLRSSPLGVHRSSSLGVCFLPPPRVYGATLNEPGDTSLLACSEEVFIYSLPMTWADGAL